MLLGRPLDTPYTYQGGNPTEAFVFYWQPRDWRAEEQSGVTIVEQFLPSDKRTPFERFVFDYAFAVSHTLRERLEKGDITLLQWVKARSAGDAYLIEQGTLYGAHLRETLVQAKAEDAKLLATVAAGLGAVVTTALVVFTAYQDYRIANAQAAQARQALLPIRCSIVPPGRYRVSLALSEARQHQLPHRAGLGVPIVLRTAHPPGRLVLPEAGHNMARLGGVGPLVAWAPGSRFQHIPPGTSQDRREWHQASPRDQHIPNTTSLVRKGDLL